MKVKWADKEDESTIDWDNVKADMSAPDRYCSVKEHKTLTNAQKKGLKVKRANRGSSSKREADQSLSNRQIKALKRMLESDAKSQI